MKKKSRQQIVRELCRGLLSQQAYEAKRLEEMNRTHAGASWFFVTRLDAFGRTQRIMVSVPHD